MSSEGAPTTIWAAVGRAADCLENDPAKAESLALDALKRAPGQAQALRVFVSARRRMGDLEGARRVLEGQARETPGIAAIAFELGLLLQETGSSDEARVALSRAAHLAPRHPLASRAQSHSLRDGSLERDGHPFQHEDNEVAGLRLMEEAARGENDQLPRAETLLRARLDVDPTDVAALHMLANVHIRLRRFEDAERELKKALDLAPDFLDARWMLAGTFFYRGNWQATLAEADRLLAKDTRNPEYLDLKTFALLNLGEVDAALACFEESLPMNSTAENWRGYGHALKVVGRQEEAVAAYRKAIALKPDFGLAWWCLADLKTFRFFPAEVEAMRELLKQPGLSANNRARIHFAMGKAFEDENQYESSFLQYGKANAALKEAGWHKAEDRTHYVRRNREVFTPAFFRDRSGWGSAARDPIFIVGLPRSGTTLIEQILSSHTQVEATIELQELEAAARRLSLAHRRDGQEYPELLQNVSAAEIRSAAEQYLAETGAYRKLKRAYFVDKMPNNFNHLGLLLLMLPKAKIIDARRHPLGSGVAIFKHYFASGHSFATDLDDIGRYYRNYVELMAHFDAVAPARIHRVFYERVVADTESEIRRLLDYCGLPFEEQCLRFYENRRAVLTPSSEQVRRPIFVESTELWRHYERWLGPLKTALGDVLDMYPEVPEFHRAGDVGQWRISFAQTKAGFETPLTASLAGRPPNTTSH